MKDEAADPKKPARPMPARYLFSVAAIEKADAPTEDDEREWYRYELVSECTRVTGLFAGSQEEAHAHALVVAEELNSRGGSSPGGWSSRQMHV